MGTLIKFILVLAIALGVAGYFLGWFKFESNKTATGDSKVSVTFNNDKIAEDAKKAGGAAKGLAKKVTDLAGLTKSEGEIAGFDMLTQKLRVKNGSEEILVKINGDTDVEVDGKDATFTDLMSMNGRAVVHYSEKDGEKVAKKIVVTKK